MAHLPPPSYRILRVPGGTTGPVWEQIRAVRIRVFLQEQNIAPEEEWDTLDTDPTVTHLAAQEQGTGIVLGVARTFLDQTAPTSQGELAPAWRIGRMAVLPEYRGAGIGMALLQEALTLGQEHSRSGSLEVRRALLSAQTHAIPFYGAAGFVAFGAEFDDAGIPHRWMERTLS